jgi:hypothetical protein
MKKIALIPIKNEDWILFHSLTNISIWADIIIVADQMSTDNSRNICAQFEKVVLIDNSRTEHSNEVRWDLLDKAREFGTNNLIVCIDADEILSLDFFKEDFTKYKPGQSFELPWIQLWKTPLQYRTDGVWKTLSKVCAFIDDGEMNYERKFIINDHTGRIPHSPFKPIKINTPLFHLEYIPFRKNQMKQAWYRCSELILGKRNAKRINATYAMSHESSNIKTSDLLIDIKSIYSLPEDLVVMEYTWHENQIMSWFKEYGITFFEPLDIWYIEKLRIKFKQKTGREPKPQMYPSFILKLNTIKNKIKNFRI